MKALNNFKSYELNNIEMILGGNSEATPGNPDPLAITATPGNPDPLAVPGNPDPSANTSNDADGNPDPS